MKFFAPLSLLTVVLCLSAYGQTAEQLADIWEEQHVTNIQPSNVRHVDLLQYLNGLKALGINVKEVGRSNANRSIHQIEWGKGPLKIFMWSQMHGDEPTATSALIDMFTVLQKNGGEDWVKKISETVTIRAVPMLNPDGAEVYIRRNLQGIDINRDALDLKTPEARLLKLLRKEWSPDIGFNLHNQNELTSAGHGRKQAAISLLVVLGDEAKTLDPGHERNLRLTAAIKQALEKLIPGHLGRYDDGWSPTAFGDNFSKWGTPTILIETGALYGQDELYLAKMNFVALMTVLKVLADGTEKNFGQTEYYAIPNNVNGRLMDYIFRNASIIAEPETGSIMIADVGINKVRRRDQFSAPTFIRRIGALIDVVGLEEYDASRFFVVGRFKMPMKAGNFGELLFFKADRKIDWTAADLEKENVPDAIFSLGKWLTGEGVVPKK